MCSICLLLVVAYATSASRQNCENCVANHDIWLAEGNCWVSTPPPIGRGFRSPKANPTDFRTLEHCACLDHTDCLTCTADSVCSWSRDREQCERLDANDLKNQSQCPNQDAQTDTSQTDTKKDNNWPTWVIPTIVGGCIVLILVCGLAVRAIGMRHRKSESYNVNQTTTVTVR